MAKSAIAKPNFGSVLDQPMADWERPPALPRGYYHTIVQSYRIDKSAQKQTEFVEYTLKILEPLEGKVDEDELEEYGEVRGQLINVQFWITEKAKFMLKIFLEHCGVKIDPKVSASQLIGEAVNCEVIAFVIHEPLQSGEGVRARVRSTAPVE